MQPIMGDGAREGCSELHNREGNIEGALSRPGSKAILLLGRKGAIGLGGFDELGGYVDRSYLAGEYADAFAS
jgi:hypothetical protein